MLRRVSPSSMTSALAGLTVANLDHRLLGADPNYAGECAVFCLGVKDHGNQDAFRFKCSGGGRGDFNVDATGACHIDAVHGCACERPATAVQDLASKMSKLRTW